MKRRTFFATAWTILAVGFGVVAFVSDTTQNRIVYGLISLFYVGIGGYYRLHPTPMDRPDDPAPRHWFALAGVVTGLVVSLGVLLVVTDTI